MYPPLFRSWNRWNKSKNGFLFKNEILLELSISSSSFGTISHPGSDEIGWIETVFCKYVIILNILTISLFSDRLEGTKETSCSFFNNLWSLVDLSVGFEPRWSSDHLSEKKERMDLVRFPRTRNSSISSGSRWLFICFSRSVNSRDIEEYPERHLGDRSDSISVRSIWRKEGSQRIDLSFSCWISLWLINVWYSESSLLMESKWSLDRSEDPFNWLKSVTWTKLDLVESYWIFDDTFRTLLKNRSLFSNHTLSNQIQFSLDMFLKKSDSCGFFPQLKKRSWRNCHIWNWAQFCKEIAHLFLEKRWETCSISFDWIVDPAPCCLKKPSASIGIFSRKANMR